jgi:hypothetical protein
VVSLQIGLLQQMVDGEAIAYAVAVANDSRVYVMAGASMVATVVCTVVFLRWFHLAYRIASSLDAQGLTRSPGDAVVSFFIPFVNLVRPYQAMKELYTALDPSDLPEPAPVPREEAGNYRDAALEMPSPRIPTPAAPIVAWWGFWIAGRLAARGSATRMDSINVSALITQSWLAVVSALLSIAAAYFAIQVVRAVTARTRERERRVQGAAKPREMPSVQQV